MEEEQAIGLAHAHTRIPFYEAKATSSSAAAPIDPHVARVGNRCTSSVAKAEKENVDVVLEEGNIDVLRMVLFRKDEGRLGGRIVSEGKESVIMVGKGNIVVDDTLEILIVCTWRNV